MGREGGRGRDREEGRKEGRKGGREGGRKEERKEREREKPRAYLGECHEQEDNLAVVSRAQPEKRPDSLSLSSSMR